MKYVLFVLPVILVSCGGKTESQPIDGAWLTIIVYFLAVLYLALKAGYYEGLAKGRKDHIKELREECNFARKLAEQECAAIVPDGDE